MEGSDCTEQSLYYFLSQLVEDHTDGDLDVVAVGDIEVVAVAALAVMFEQV